VEELSFSCSTESSPEHHHWIGTAGRVAALRLPGLSGTVPGMKSKVSSQVENGFEQRLDADFKSHFQRS